MTMICSSGHLTFIIAFFNLFIITQVKENPLFLFQLTVNINPALFKALQAVSWLYLVSVWE